jgi:hypothetical protein
VTGGSGRANSCEVAQTSRTCMIRSSRKSCGHVCQSVCCCMHVGVLRQPVQRESKTYLMGSFASMFSKWTPVPPRTARGAALCRGPHASHMSTTYSLSSSLRTCSGVRQVRNGVASGSGAGGAARADNQGWPPFHSAQDAARRSNALQRRPQPVRSCSRTVPFALATQARHCHSRRALNDPAHAYLINS